MMILTGRKAKEEKVEQLLLENYDRYYRLAFSYVHNSYDAGDIVQNGAYKAIRNSGSLKNQEYAATWLYRIMLNEIYDFYHQKKAISIETLEESGEAEPSAMDTEEALIKSSLPQSLRRMRTDLQGFMLLRNANPARETL